MPLDNIKNCLCRQLDCPWEEFAFDVMHFRLDHKVAIMRNASSVAKAFREMRMGFDEQLTYYRDIREIIVGSYSYTRKKKFRKPDIKNYASYVEACKGRNPRLLNVMSVQNLLNEQAEKITAIKNPTDFLNAIYDCANWMDDAFDHGYVKALFVDRIRSDEQVLLINPTPDFLTYYPERLFSRTTVAVRLEQMAELLQLQYPNLSFLSFDTLPDIGAFHKILFWGTALDRTEQNRILDHLAVDALKDISLYVLFPTTGREDDNEFFRKITERFSVISIALFPGELFRTNPRRKIMLRTSSDPNGNWVGRCRLTKYAAELRRGKTYLIQQETYTIAQEQLASPASFYKQYLALTSQSDKERHRSACYSFSPEIRFYYKMSPIRGKAIPKIEAYVVDFSSVEHLKQRPEVRGKRIPGAYASTSTTPADHVEDWCEMVLPYKTSIHSSFRAAYQKAVSSKKPVAGLENGVSLKTFWYLHLEAGQEKNISPSLPELALFSSPELGFLRLNDFIYPTEAFVVYVQEQLEKFLYRRQDLNRADCLNMLHKLLMVAVDEKILTLESLIPFFQAEKDDKDDTAFKQRISQARSALSKRTFTIQEDRLLIQHLLGRLPTDVKGLAVLIRCFTGLESNIVSALNWGDLVSIPYIKIHQLLIYHQNENANSRFREFTSSANYRRIPVVAPLYQALRQRKDYIKSAFSYTDSSLKDIQIIATDEYLSQNATMRVVPRTVNNWTKSIIDSLGIKDKEIFLEDMDRGCVETNMAAYHGDILRSNFRYKMHYSCFMTPAERNYLAGIQQASTFARNYCDFTNDFSQLVLYQKLSRWVAEIFPETPKIAMTSCVIGEKAVSVHENTLLQLHLPAYQDIRLDIKNDSGVLCEGTIWREPHEDEAE